MYSHEKECMYRLVPCKRGCGLPVAAKDASNHKCVEELKNRLQSKWFWFVCVSVQLSTFAINM